jgi:hypothetical protein
MVYNIAVCVFSCITIEKYRLQVDKINETWGAKARETPNVKVFFFLGEERVPEEYVYLSGVKNDYMSSSYKQNLGIKHIHEHYPAYDFVFVCGTDTYINIPKLSEFLEEYNPAEKLYIGGHGQAKYVTEKLTLFFHLGGAGFVLSKRAVRMLHPFLGKLTDEWIKYCGVIENPQLELACDVCIAYYAHLLGFNRQTFHSYFYECNYRGLMDVSHLRKYFSIHRCCADTIQWKDIISCHNMSLRDFDDFTDILQQEKFYIGEKWRK